MRKSTLVFPIMGNTVFLARKKSKIGSGLYNGWGGKLEPEDKGSLECCAVREFQQESGAEVTLASLEKVAIIDFYLAGRHSFECHIFFCRRWYGQFHETSEMGPPEAFRLKVPPLDQMMLGDRRWAPLIFGGQKIRGQCYYTANFSRVLCFEYGPL